MTNTAFNNDYSDLDFDLAVHPSYGDIVPIKGYKAIRQSVRNLVMMRKNTRPFQPYLNSAVPEFLFDYNDMFTKMTIVEEVQRVLAQYEPRVNNVRVDVVQEGTSLNIVVTYNIVSASNQTDTVVVEVRKLS